MDLGSIFDDSKVLRSEDKCPYKKLQFIKSEFQDFGDFPSKVNLNGDVLNSHSDILGEQESSNESRQSCLIKPPITYWRVADHHDSEEIYKLLDVSDRISDEIFGTPEIPELLEKAMIRVVQFNANREMISFTCSFAHPNIPAVPSFDWIDWLHKMYPKENISPRNTSFIHYMVWRPEYADEFLGLVLETMFMSNSFLKNIIIIRPPLVKIPEVFSDYFIPILPKDANAENWDANSVQVMLTCVRHTIQNRLKIRLAIVEDHDDLMPIIERQSDKLRLLYGDFCMAEIIEFPGTEDRKTLVCEVMGKAVAFMTLNKAIDLELLNTQFDLGVFHGLRKPTEQDKTAEILEDDKDQEVFMPATVRSSLDLINSETMEHILNWRPLICDTEKISEAGSSSDSEDSTGLSQSLIDLIRESLRVKIYPKFSAYALESADSDENLYYSEYGEGHGTIKTELSLISLQYYNLPEYHGASNAFCIELFAVHEDFDEKTCTDFLEAAFELFPDLEYCLITIPSQCTVFPLLETFVRVTPRPLKRFKQELYVCHKSSIMIKLMKVERADKSNLNEISQLLRGIQSRDIIFADIANACLYPESAYQGFVLICDSVIVGMAVICNENGLEYLRDQYQISDYIDFELHKIDEHGILKHLALSPIYQTHARFFLRDIMRKADITSLYRARYETQQTSLITVLGQMVPILPRKVIKYHEPSLKDNTPPSYFHSERPFALYHINSRICSFAKVTSNVMLVVVGASRTAYSFLENLLYGPSAAYVTYNNITWVSPHGMESEMAPHYARDLMFPYKGKYDSRYKSQIALHSFVNFVFGVMTEINRTEKYITVNNDAILRYDYLMIFCGKQFLMPIPSKKEVELQCHRNYRSRSFLFKYLQVPKDNSKIMKEVIIYPPNMFLINSPVDATNALLTVQYLLRKRRDVDTDEKIIIYGQNLEAYLCIQSLLKFGVPSKFIVLIEPPAKNYSLEMIFMDPDVDLAVTQILKELNIAHYRDYVLYDWTFCNDKQVKTATFHTANRKVTINCMAMFPFVEKLVSEVTFKALNEASLVYDGKLVIDNNFRTNDPYIYSAGPITKYKRSYCAKDKCHDLYCSAEVGKLLSKIISEKIDPTVDNRPSATTENVLPELTHPLLIHGQLPGDWNYFSLRKPGKYVPMEVRCNIKEYGDTLVTGDCSMSRGYGYFRIDLDDYGFIRTIICFTKDIIDVENLPMLYGMHEKYLNDLLLRYDCGMITDFYAYFRQPWVYALYHDRFKWLMNLNKNFFNEESTFPGNEKRIVDVIVEALEENKWEKLGGEKLGEIINLYEHSSVKENITKNLIDYLTLYDGEFPMYATSKLTRILLHEANTSLLHKTMSCENNNLE